MMNQHFDERYETALVYHLKPLMDLFLDAAITDIESNPNGKVFVHYIDGTSAEKPVTIDGKSITAIAQLLGSKTQNGISPASPSMAAVWPDPPCRLHIILPPATEHPSMVIRRFSPVVFPLTHYIETGSCTEEQLRIMRTLIRERKNVVVSGETGSGKTTLLNSLISEIDERDRLFIIQDTNELQCSNPNRVSVLCGDLYSAAAAVKDALRFRPDRIIVGEVRDGAALDMLEAWNTGHPGGLCSIHANSTGTVKQRLAALIRRVSRDSQMDTIDTAVDAAIQMTLCQDGIRRITDIKLFK